MSEHGLRSPWSLLSAMIAATVGFPLLSIPAIAQTPSAAHANRLINSGSPYLLQHAHNPVDWYPWGKDAFAKAKTENKLIFLSIGYSTCYWCHVAERTIYSDPAIAAQMNNWFVNVKVDREERPDIDETYMLARQLLTGAGGWPNNLFLTPDLKPFFAGSYFPPKDQEGEPGFPAVLKLIHEDWEKDAAKIKKASEQVYAALARLRDAGDVINLVIDGTAREFRLTRINDAWSRSMEAQRSEGAVYSPPLPGLKPPVFEPPPVYGRAILEFLDLPMLRDSDVAYAPYCPTSAPVGQI